jgi:hypothetical protein
VLTQAFAVFIVVLLGAALGWLCRRMPIRPIAQDLCAAVLGWIAGFIGTVLVMVLVAVWWQSSLGSGGLGAVSVGFSGVDLVGLAAVVLLASLARLALLRLGAKAPAVVRTHSAVVLGAGFALLSALWTLLT